MRLPSVRFKDVPSSVPVGALPADGGFTPEGLPEIEPVVILLPFIDVTVLPSSAKSPSENVTRPEKDIPSLGVVPVSELVVAIPVTSMNKKSEK